ncbi:DUF536 domain-containing protein [Lentilactobacillus senioris]|uniref:DUF536 domain-containing protein n=1 Tax=Lentilactobacillus senioris TaxID=931534 RepID=UPI0006D1C2F0|nr:DUF536 domain-containing protein [Lentilactobacillus senioris]
MSESIKDIADEIGVSKTAIRKRMTDEFRKTRTEKQGNKILITDEGGVAELKEQFKASGITEQDTAEDDDQVDLARQELGVLSEQLTSQSDQLKEKDRQIAELHKLLDQSQQLQLDVQQRMKQLETSKAEVQAIETAEQPQADSETKPGKVKLESQSEETEPEKINPLPPRSEDATSTTTKRRWWPFGRQKK